MFQISIRHVSYILVAPRFLLLFFTSRQHCNKEQGKQAQESDPPEYVHFATTEKSRLYQDELIVTLCNHHRRISEN